MSKKQSMKTSEHVIVNEEVIDVVALRAEVKKAGMRFWVLLILISLLSSLVVPYLSMASVAVNGSTVFDGEVIPGYSMGGIDIASYGVDLNEWARPAKQTNSNPTIVQSQYGYWTPARAKNASKNLADSQKKDKDTDNADLQGYEVKDEILNGDEKARGWIGITRDKGEGTGLTDFANSPAGEDAAGRKNYNESVAPYRTQADYTFWDSQTIGGASPSITTTIYPDFVIVGWDSESKSARVLTNPDSIQNMTNSDGGSTSGVLAGTAAVPHYVPLSTLFKEFKLSDTVMGDNGMVNLDSVLDAIAAEARSNNGSSPTLNKIVENKSNSADYDLLLGTHYDNLNGENKSKEKGSDAWNPYPYSMVFKMATENGTIVSSIYNNNEAYVYFSPRAAYTNYLALRSEYDALVNSNATLVADKDPAATFQLGYYLAGMSILEAYLNETLPQDMTRGYVGPVEGNPLAAADAPLTDAKKLDTRSGSDQTIAKLFQQSLTTVDQMVTKKTSTAAQEAEGDEEEQAEDGDGSKKAKEDNPDADVSKIGFKSVAYSQLMYDFADSAIVKYGQSGKKTRLGATSAIMNTLSTYGYGTNDTGLLTNGQNSAGQGPNRGMTRRQNMSRMTSFGPYGDGSESLAITINKDDEDPLIKPDVENNANTGMYVPVYYPIQQHVMPVDPEMTYRFQVLSLIPYNTLAYELGKHGFNSSVNLSYANNAISGLQSNKNYYSKSAALARQFDDLDQQGGSLSLFDTGQSIVLNPQTNTTTMVGDKTTQEYSQDKTLTERVDNALKSFTTNLMNSDNVHDLVDIVRAVPGLKYETFVRYFNPIKSSGGATDIFLTRVTPAQTTYMPAILTKGYESAGGVTNSTNTPSTATANFDYFSLPSFAPCFAAHTAEDTYYGALNYELRPFYTSDFLSSLPADTNIPALEQYEETCEKQEEADEETAIKGMKEKVVTIYVLGKRLAFSTAYGALTAAQDGKDGTVTLGSLYHASDKLTDVAPGSEAVKKALTPNNLDAYVGPETDNGSTGLKENLVEGTLPGDDSSSAGDGGSMEENAKKIWQVFSYWGLTDEEISGILSNFETECAIDPTGIEACFDDEYGMGGRKASMSGNDEAAKDAMSSWTQNEMRAAYAATGISLAWDFYGPGSDGRFYPGIGICSWTGYSQVPQILDKSREMGKKWWDMDFQIAYLLVDPNNSPPGEALWEKMKNECGGKSPYDCAFWFYTTVEMPGNCGPAGWDHLHSQHADKWLGMIKGWSKDDSYAKKVIDMAHKINGTSSSGSGSSRRSKAMSSGDATQVISGSTSLAQAPSTATDSTAANSSATSTGNSSYADNGGEADKIYASDGLADRGYIKATDAQWKAIEGKHLVGDSVSFHIPKGITFKADGDFDYAMQEFGQKHIIPDSTLNKKVVWCKDSNGYAFVTSVKSIFAALYKDTYNRYLAPNGEYYWDKAETIAEYGAQSEANSLEEEAAHYNTVAIEYSKATDAADAKKNLNEYCDTAFAEASKYLPNKNVINDELPPQMQNVLAWADTQTASESEGNYLNDPSVANDTFIEITGKKDEDNEAGGSIHSFIDLQEAGFIVLTNNDAWAAVPDNVAAAVATGTRSNAIQSRMKRGVAGATATASETLAAYTITATVGRIDRLVSTQSSKSSIPYSGIYGGNLNSGAEQYSLLQAHSIDRQSISSGLAGDLRKRDSSNALVTLNNPQSTPETQNYIQKTSSVTNELLASAVPGSVDMVVNAMGTQTSTGDTTTKNLKGSSTQSQAGTLFAGTNKTTQTLALASTFDDTTMNRESSITQTFNTANRTMTSSGASATASAMGSVSDNRKLAESLVNGAFSDAYAVIQSIALIMVLAFLMIIAFQNFIAYNSGNENDYIMAQTKLKTVLPRTLIAVAMIGLPPLGGGVGFQGGCFLLLQVVNSVMDAVLSVFTQGNDITAVIREIGETFITDFDIFDIAGTVLNLIAALIFMVCSAIIMLLVFLTDIILFLFWAIGPIAWAFYVWPYGGADRQKLASEHGLKKVLGTITGKMGSKVFMNGEIGRDAPSGWLMGYIMTLSTTVKWIFLYWGVGVAFDAMSGASGVSGLVNTVGTAGAAGLDPSDGIQNIDAGGFLLGTGVSVFTGIFGNLLLALLFALVTYMTFRTFKNSMGGAIGAMYGLVGDITTTVAKTAATGFLGGLGGAAGKASTLAKGLKESENPLKKLAGAALDSKPVQFGLEKTGDIARATESIANSEGASDLMKRVNKMTDNLAKDVDERAASSGAFDKLVTVGTETEEYVDEDGKTQVRTRHVMQAAPAIQLGSQLTKAAVGAQYRQLATAKGMTTLASRAVQIAHDPEFRALQQQESLVDMLGSADTGLGSGITAKALNLISGKGGPALTKTEAKAIGNCLRSYRDDYINRDANATKLERLQAMDASSLTAEDRQAMDNLERSVARADKFSSMLGTTDNALGARLDGIDDAGKKKLLDAEIGKVENALQAKESSEKFADLADRQEEIKNHHYEKEASLDAMMDSLASQSPEMAAQMAEIIAKSVNAAEGNESLGVAMVTAVASTAASQTLATAKGTGFSEFANTVAEAGKNDKLGTHQGKKQLQAATTEKVESVEALGSLNKTMQFVNDDIEQHYHEAPKTAQRRQIQGRGDSLASRRQSSRLASAKGRAMTRQMHEANPELAKSQMSQAELQQTASRLEKGKQARLDALNRDYKKKDRALKKEAHQQHKNINEAYKEAESHLKRANEEIQQTHQPRLGNGNASVPAVQTRDVALDVTAQAMLSEMKDRRDRQHASTDEGIKIARDMAKRDRDIMREGVEAEVKLAQRQASYSDEERATWQSEERSEAHAKMILKSSKGKKK